MKAFPANSFATATDTEGMDLRDYFAAKAMQADISNISSDDEHDEIHWEKEHIAKRAYAMADAMMEAREQK